MEQVLHPSCCLFPSPPFVVLLDGVPLKSLFLVCHGVLRVGSRDPCGSFTYPRDLAATIWTLRQLFLDSRLCQRVCLSISTLAVVGPLRSWQWGLWGREQDQGCSLGPNSRLGAALSFDPPEEAGVGACACRQLTGPWGPGVASLLGRDPSCQAPTPRSPCQLPLSCSA